MEYFFFRRDNMKVDVRNLYKAKQVYMSWVPCTYKSLWMFYYWYSWSFISKQLILHKKSSVLFMFICSCWSSFSRFPDIYERGTCTCNVHAHMSGRYAYIHIWHCGWKSFVLWLLALFTLKFDNKVLSSAPNICRITFE